MTKNGLDPLLPECENTAEIVEPPTEEEMNSAITKTVGHILAVVNSSPILLMLCLDRLTTLQIKAVKKFKRLIDPHKEEAPMQSILGGEYEAHFVEPPLEMEPDESFEMSNSMPMANKSQSLDTYNREALERDNVLRGYHHQRGEIGRGRPPGIDGVNLNKNELGSISSTRALGGSFDDPQTVSTAQSALSRTNSAATKRSVEGTRGHARDPLEEEFPFLFIGPSTYTGSSHTDTIDSQPAPIFEEPESTLTSETPHTQLAEEEDGPVPIVSESPGVAEIDIYETAYRQEIERIRERSIPRRGTAPKMYLTRRVEGRDDVTRLVQENEHQQPASQTVPALGNKVAVSSSSSFSSAVGMIRAQLEDQKKQPQQPQQQPQQPQPRPQSQLENQPAPAQQQQQQETQPTTSETSSREPPSSPENPRAKLRCLLGRVKGS